MSDDLIKQSAVDIVTLLRKGEVSPRELLEALELRISEVDEQVNALPTLCFERGAQSRRRAHGKAFS